MVHGYLNLLAGLLPEQPSIDINFSSAGFKESGRPAGKPIREVAYELGFQLDEHRSTTLDTHLVEWANIIIHMGPGNEKRLRRFITEKGMDVGFYMSKAHSLGHWCGRRNIQDFAFIKPGTEKFDTVVRYTVAACNKLMQEVIVPQATEEQAKARFVTETEKGL